MKKIFFILIMVPSILVAMAEESSQFGLWDNLPAELKHQIVTYFPIKTYQELEAVLLVSKQTKEFAVREDSYLKFCTECAQNIIESDVARAERFFLRAIEKGKTKEVAGFIRAGINVNARTADNDSALEVALKNGHRRIAHLLAGCDGIDVNARSKKRGLTLLFMAASRNDRELVRLLLEKGAQPNAKLEAGTTVLMRIVSLKTVSIEIVKMLIAHGASVEAHDGVNKTVLHNAAKSGNAKVVELLLSNKAIASILEYVEISTGKSAIDYANDNGHHHIAAMIKEALEKAVS